MYGALQHIVPSHLMDGAHHPFKNIRATGVLEPDSDKAFDEETFARAAPLPSSTFLPASAIIQTMSRG